MKEYKIKVANEAESKEAQELLFELGYSWRGTRKEYFKIINFSDRYIFALENMRLCIGNSRTGYGAEFEITLPQLRDLVVLHRNDVNDATHKCKNNDKKWFLTSEKKLYYFNIALNKWQPFGNTATEVILKDYAVPITKEQMTWQDALLAVVAGKEVELLDSHNQWENILDFSMCSVLEPNNKFRLKPQTIHLKEDDYTKEELLKIVGEMGD